MVDRNHRPNVHDVQGALHQSHPYESVGLVEVQRSKEFAQFKTLNVYKHVSGLQGGGKLMNCKLVPQRSYVQSFSGRKY